MHLLAIPGSLRAGSHNARLLRAAADLLPPGATVDVWDGLQTLPPFSEDAETDPPAAVVAAALASIARADAVLIATPEYNGSVPGALKNALDWASRPYATNVLRGKRVAVVGASSGPFGAVWAQADARRILRQIGADVVDAEVSVGLAADAYDDDGRLRDVELATSLAALIDELLALPAAALPGAATGNSGPTSRRGSSSRASRCSPRARSRSRS